MMYHYRYNLGMVDLLVLLLIFSVRHIYVCDGVATKMAIRGANHDAVGRGYSNVECFTGKTEILDIDIVKERREAVTLKKGGKGSIAGCNISSSMGRSKNHYYSRKLLFFNEPVFSVHYRPVSSSLVSTSLITAARHMYFSKILSSFIYVTATAPAPAHNPSPSMEPPIYPPPKINHKRRRGHPPNPPLIPFLNPSAAPHARARHRRPHGRHHHRNRTLPVALGPSPMHGNVPSPHLPPHHNHMKPPWVAISPAHGPIPPKSREKPPPSLPPMNSLPSPPPNEECGNTCIAPYTETLLGSPCGCVRPVKVKLELGVALYMLFPQISMLAEEIAESVLLSQSQVRVVGANADSQDQSKSIVDIDLVPLGDSFDNITVLLIFQKVWNHEVSLNATVFGNYSVIFVHYPGLPPSPPEVGGVGGPEGSMEQPFGTNVKRKHGQLHKGTVILIALSSVIAVVMLVMAVWLLLLKCNSCTKQTTIELPIKTPSIAKRAGSMFSSDKGSSTTLSFVSSMAAYTGSAKTFTLSELERATDNFKLQNIVGEGGFGRVYSGVLDDGAKVAVKVLTRDDQQGRKEFIAEVEMLSRLHHRNLVRLIGFCTEDHARCLVYELVPNGSVESHLHGVDKEASPLDWDARMRIALGAARALAYLHEDSNPRVIHRDFKASNILLEDDFTPKVSDFGLAKAAPDQGSGHISTRVMGTFGYVAPEYAMTGHLLVKSDVYSYGVVMLELLTGRKPVDMSQIGQENLVTWARPLLSTREGLEILVDPALGTLFPFENMAKVAAIASMCVHPEVSHRPFMGEVVQALKLVCNEGEASNGGITSANASQTAESPSRENSNSAQSERILSTRYLPENASFISVEDYDSGSFYTGDIMQKDRPRSASAILSTSGRLLNRLSGSFRRHSSSGPLRMSRKWAARYKVRGGGGPNYHGSLSEHAMASHFRSGFGRRTHESSS